MKKTFRIIAMNSINMITSVCCPYTNMPTYNNLSEFPHKSKYFINKPTKYTLSRESP